MTRYKADIDKERFTAKADPRFRIHDQIIPPCLNPHEPLLPQLYEYNFDAYPRGDVSYEELRHVSDEYIAELKAKIAHQGRPFSIRHWWRAKVLGAGGEEE